MTDQLSYETPQKVLTAPVSRLDVAVIALRLIGCYLLLQVVLLSIAFTPGLLSSLQYASSPWLELAIPLGMVAGATLAGVCMIVFAESIGRRLLPSGGGAPSAGHRIPRPGRRSHLRCWGFTSWHHRFRDLSSTPAIQSCMKMIL